MRQKSQAILATCLMGTLFFPRMLHVEVRAEDTLKAEIHSEQSTLLPLDLQNVLDQVENNHPKMKGAELERRMASAKRLEKQGAFDPAIWIDNDTQRYNSVPERGKVKYETLNEVFVGQQTRQGAKIGIGSRYNYLDVKSPASGTGDAGTYFLGLNIPLLRGGWINEKSAAERKALIGEPLANAEYHQFRIAMLLRASDSYWNWVAAKQKLDTNLLLLKLSELRAKQIQIRVERGDLPPIDSIEADQEVQRRQEMQFKSLREFQKATLSLSTYLWNNTSSAIAPPQPEQVPLEFNPPRLLEISEIEQAKSMALEKRPEILQLKFSQEITDVDLSLAKNQRLPIVDLYAGPGLDTGSESIGATFKTGISVMVPLRQRTARGQIQQAKLKLGKLGFDRQALMQQIKIEVDDAASEINMAYQRYQAAAQAYNLAKQLEDGERNRFSYGDSTLFLVNQRERSTAEAKIRLIEIQAEYQQASVRLQAVTGEL